MALNIPQLDMIANIAKRPEFKDVPFVAMIRALTISKWNEAMAIEVLTFAITYPSPVKEVSL